MFYKTMLAKEKLKNNVKKEFLILLKKTIKQVLAITPKISKFFKKKIMLVFR